MKLTILNTREIKKIRENIIQQFGSFLKNEYVYLKNDKYKIFIVNRDISQIELKNLRIDRAGLYFAEVKGDQIRLSKEGTQLLFKENQGLLKNLIELNQDEVKRYFCGEDLEKNLSKDNRFIILIYEKNVLGCAKYKDGKIINFLPKQYRGETIL